MTFCFGPDVLVSAGFEVIHFGLKIEQRPNCVLCRRLRCPSTNRVIQSTEILQNKTVCGTIHFIYSTSQGHMFQRLERFASIDELWYLLTTVD